MNVLEQTLSAIEVGDPVVHGNLAMYPLRHPAVAEPDYLLLDEALAEGLVTITEVDESGRVPELRLQSRAPRPVLLLDGEELVGAKQNRVLNLTLLVGAKASCIIPVSCVEAGRWGWATRAFSTSDRAHFARGRARRVASVSAALVANGERYSDQMAVWSDVDELLDTLDTSSPTSAMADAYQEWRDPVEGHVGAMAAREGQTGALFAIDGRVSGLDLFDSAVTLARLLPKLVRSHALDAIGSARAAKGRGEGERSDVAAFLDRLRHARVHASPAIGLGEDLRLEGEGVAGAALAVDGRVVHLCAFPLHDEGGPGGPGTRIVRASRRFRR